MFNKILCIDDDSISLILSKMVITKTGMANDVITHLGGDETLSYYQNLVDNNQLDNYPELILLDLNMPIMNGWEFLERFKQDYLPHFPNTKIVVLSSSIDPFDVTNSNENPHVVKFASKPITKDLLEEIERLIS